MNARSIFVPVAALASTHGMRQPSAKSFAVVKSTVFLFFMSTCEGNVRFVILLKDNNYNNYHHPVNEMLLMMDSNNFL